MLAADDCGTRARSHPEIVMETGDTIQRAIDVPESVKVAVHDHLVTLSGSVQWVHYLRRDVRAVVLTENIKAAIGDRAHALRTDREPARHRQHGPGM
jgi:hypothetical protein